MMCIENLFLLASLLQAPLVFLILLIYVLEVDITFYLLNDVLFVFLVLCLLQLLSKTSQGTYWLCNLT